MSEYTSISGGAFQAPSLTYAPNGNMLTGSVGAPVSGSSSLTYDREHTRRLVGWAEFAEQSPERGDFSMLGINHQNRLRTGTSLTYTYGAYYRRLSLTAGTNDSQLSSTTLVASHSGRL